MVIFMASAGGGKFDAEQVAVAALADKGHGAGPATDSGWPQRLEAMATAPVGSHCDVEIGPRQRSMAGVGALGLVSMGSSSQWNGAAHWRATP
jgi:hypothetical protein